MKTMLEMNKEATLQLLKEIGEIRGIEKEPHPNGGFYFNYKGHRFLFIAELDD